MFASLGPSAARVKVRKAEKKTRQRSGTAHFRQLTVEMLESRLAPATASFSLPSAGYSGPGAGGVITGVPIDVSTLSGGLSAATIVLTYPTGVFAFPTGGSAAAADVSLGAIPNGAGGTAGWCVTANSTADGNLIIGLTAKTGYALTGNVPGDSLVLVNFPVADPYNPTVPANEPIRIVSAASASHTQIVGNGSYTLSPPLPYSGMVTVLPVSQQPPTVTTPQSYATVTNMTLNAAAPGLLSGASDPQGQNVAVNSIDGVAYTPGTQTTLPSGALLTVSGDGSFSYVPANNLVGTDSFTFTVQDQSGNVSSPGTANVTLTPTLHIVPKTVASGPAGAVIEEDIYLNNPNPPSGLGPLAGFNVALTYDPTALAVSSIARGQIPADWIVKTNALTPGVVGIGAFGKGSGSDLVAGPAPLELASIDFTVVATTAQSTPIQFVSMVPASAGVATTALIGDNGIFPLNPEPGAPGAPFVTGVDTAISIQGSATGLVVSPPTLSDNEVGVAYQQTVTASGGATPYTFTVLYGTLPPGVNLDANTGALSGTPTAAGSYLFGIRATDSAGITGAQAYHVTIAPALAITTSSLPDGTVNQSGYSQTFTTSGGVGSAVFSATGILPPGLKLNDAGVFSGTPTAAGTYTVTVRAIDSQGGNTSQSLTLTIHLALTTTTLGNWTVNQPGYSQTLSATGSSGAFTFSSTSPLPVGLTLSSSGVLSGAPTTVGTYTFNVVVTDSAGDTGNQIVSVTINPALTITANLPDWTSNLAYQQTVQTAGGTGIVTFSSTGAFPTGLTLSTSGVISGTPTMPGSYSFTVIATDKTSATASQAYALTINPMLAITTSALAPAFQVQPGYSQTISAVGGTGPLTFTSSGMLPPGLTLSSGGVLTGTPTTAGGFPFAILVSDSVGSSGSQFLSVTIYDAVAFATTSLPAWTTGVVFNQTISVLGGSGPLTYLGTGSLPGGLTLGSNGVLSGTPKTAGTYMFAVTVKDGQGATGSQPYSLVINPSISISPRTLPHWFVNQPGFSTTFAAGGGTGATQLALSGDLPPGLTFSSNGILSGTPTLTGGFAFSVQGTDAIGASGSTSYVLFITSLTLGSNLGNGSTPNGDVGMAYNHTVLATGGLGPYTFSEMSGTLPIGVVLTTAGVLTGLLYSAGTFNFTVMVTDAQGSIASAPYTVTVFPAPSITTHALTEAFVNAAYSATIPTTGGSGSYTYSLAAGTLPAGITMSPAGLLSGTASALTSGSLTVMVTDALGGSGSQKLTLAVNSPMSISPATFVTGEVGVPYQQTISATGGTGSYLFNNTVGTLPPGLTLFLNGQLGGTPSAAGVFNFALAVSDNLGGRVTQSYTLTINPPVAITTSSLPAGMAGVQYTQTVNAAGGNGTYTFTVVAGTLPSGMALNANGVLTGAPDAGGIYNVTVLATDSLGGSSSQNLTLNIAPTSGILLTPNTLADAEVSAGYNQTITPLGGNLPITFAVTAGTLPVGFTLSQAGVLTGMPSATGVYSFTVIATDSTFVTAFDAYTLTVHPALTIKTTSLARGVVGTAYSQTLSATGGSGSYTFSLLSGTLPTGLMLSSDGVLSGTPSSPGVFSISVAASDALGGSAPRVSFRISVSLATAIALSPASVPSGDVGFPYNLTFTASQGLAPYTFSMVFVPPGLTLSPAGVLSGTPSAADTLDFTITATDSTGATGSQAYRTAINAPLAFGTTSLPDWGANLPGYLQTIAVTGGTMPSTFSYTGQLPPNMTLTPLGVLSGTPASVGTYSFTATFTDAIGASASQSFTLNIVSIPTITLIPSALPDGEVGGVYDQTIQAQGYTVPVKYAITAGALPFGLTLTSAGILIGVTQFSGVFGFTVSASAGLAGAGSQAYTFIIHPAVAISLATDLITSQVAGVTYNETITATGGTSPYSFAVSGMLPPGLNWAVNGVVSGTAVVVGTFTFVVTVTDALGVTASQAFTVTVASAGITLSPYTLPGSVAGATYNQFITASGGMAPYAFGVSTGTFPPGLSLDTSGVLSGSPTTVGNYFFTVTAVDAAGSMVTEAYTISISSPTRIILYPTGGTLAAMRNVPFAQAFTAAGGVAPYTFAISAGQLPTGLTFSASGLLGGMPTITGTFNFTVKVTDAVGSSISQAYSITIGTAAPVSITTATLPSWTAILPYNQTIIATGGTGIFSFSVTGALPPGLNLSASGVYAGGLTGTPTIAGTYTFMVKATDTLGNFDSKSYIVTINPQISFAGGTLPQGYISQPGYNATLSATGGTGTLTFTTIGNPPPGLTLSSGGVLSGTPSAMGTFSFYVQARDAVGAATGQGYTLRIVAPTILTLGPSFLLSGRVGTAYSQTVTAVGGVAPYRFSVTSGNLPAGVTLSSAGLLNGTPAASGPYTFTVTATDNASHTGSMTYTLTVSPQIAIVTTFLPNGIVNASYSQTIVATGASGSYTFTKSAGTLPTGLTLSEVGVLSGTPSAAGVFAFMVTVTDTVGNTVSQTFIIAIANASITVLPLALPNGDIGLAYAQTLGAIGGSGLYAFGVSSGKLPSGLTLVSTGVLGGLPTAVGSFSFVVTATDGTSAPGSQAYTVTVNPALAITITTLPNTDADASYSQSINVSGGSGSYVFSSALGTLPPGLVLNSTGVISGIPSAAGAFTFTVTAIDTLGGNVSQSYVMTVNPPVTITATSLPNGTVGTGYNQTMMASGGGGSYAFGVTAGLVPAGLVLSSTGILAGTPLVGGTFSFTVTAADTLGGSASHTYTVTIAGTSPVGATLSWVTSGLTAAIDVANLNDGSGHFGLASGTFVVTFPTGVFNFPTGNNAATANVSDGSILLASGGTSNWSLTANSPADGTLLVTLSAKPGRIINSTAGGSLVIITFPVILNANTTTLETIQIIATSGPTHTQIVGSNGTYATSSLGLPARGVMVINPAAQPVSITTPQTYSTETNTTLKAAVPGLLTGASDPQGLAMMVNSINGAAYVVGSAVSLPSGAVLTVGGDGSFTYIPASNFVGKDTFNFTAQDTAGSVSNPGMVTITIGATLSLSPLMVTGISGQSITEQVILDNPGQAGTDGLAAFNLALTYPAGSLSITGVDPGPNLPGDWTFTTNIQTAGVIGFAGFGTGSGMDVVTAPSPLVLATIHIRLGQAPATVPLEIVPQVMTPTGTPTTALSSVSSNFVISPQLSSSFIPGVDATINIAGIVPLALTSSALPDGTMGAVYNQTIGMVGGAGPYTFTVTSGTLPAGLTVNNSGVLSGTPAAAGNFSFTVTATDAMGDRASQSYGVTIAAAPVVTLAYVDPSFTGSGDPATDPGLGLMVGFNAFSMISAALSHIASGGTLVLYGGTYDEPALNINVPLSALDIASNPHDSVASSTVTISNPVTLSSSVTFTTGAGSGPGNIIFSSSLDGPGSLTLSGGVSVTFNGNAGSAAPLTGITLMDSSNVALNAGVLATLGTLSSSSPASRVVLNIGSELITGTAGSTTFAGAITGAGALAKEGPITWFMLSGNNAYTGSTSVVGTLTINGSLGATSSPVRLTDPSSVVDGSGTVSRPVVVTGTASGATISGINLATPQKTSVDVEAGANNVTISGVNVSASDIGILVEPGAGTRVSITGCSISGSTVGLEFLNGTITATSNVITGNNVGVYIPAVNPNSAALPINPLLTLEGNSITSNVTGLQNASIMGVTAILNWWGNSTGPSKGEVVGVPVNDYTPYALDTTSAGPQATTFDFFNGTGADGNVYVTGTLGTDTIWAFPDATNADLIHIRGPHGADYLRGGPSDRVIIYGFGADLPGNHDTILVNGNWNAEIHAATLTYRQPLGLAGISSSNIDLTGTGSDVIFGGGNDNISARTSGNNVIVLGLSKGMTGTATSPRVSLGGGANIYIAGSVDGTLAPLAPSGRLDYSTLRAMDDLWASGTGGLPDALSAAALFSVVNTPGAIQVGTARAFIKPANGPSWLIVKGASNPSNTPTGINNDHVSGSASRPNYRQAIQ
jgi:Putative Ig domain/Bacterial Ig domain